MASTTVQTFSLPDVGEGLTEADILTWHIAVGDTVAINDTIVEIETAKSVVELPSPFAGVIEEIHVAEGDTVAVGSTIVSIGTASPGPQAEDSDTPKPSETDDVSVAAESEAEPKLLVGYGARDSNRVRRRRGGSTPPGGAPAASDSASGRPTTTKPRAKPPVRKLAKDLGVDLETVEPTGQAGTIVRGDVLRMARTAGSWKSDEEGTSTDATGSTEETRIPIKGIRKATAQAMVASAFTAPHVTEFVTVDVTKTLELRKSVQQRQEFRDVKLSPLVFVARAYLRALADVPTGNARWDEDAQEIVIPSAVNLGIAAATSRGLIVPNIKDAQSMSLNSLAIAIGDLAATARAGKTPPDTMANGTTTITNVGVFGVDTGTPILNPGETAILAVGAIRRQPWVVEDSIGERVEPRSIMQLALSFDHRVMDGQAGSELLATTASLLVEPGLAML